MSLTRSINIVRLFPNRFWVGPSFGRCLVTRQLDQCLGSALAPPALSRFRPHDQRYVARSRVQCVVACSVASLCRSHDTRLLERRPIVQSMLNRSLSRSFLGHSIARLFGQCTAARASVATLSLDHDSVAPPVGYALNAGLISLPNGLGRFDASERPSVF